MKKIDWNQIAQIIDSHSLLKHPFYQAWQKGELTIGDLKIYAKEYYHLESAFPRFISRVHSATENPMARRELLKNLVSEEIEGKSHRELWLDFAGALGVSKEEMSAHAPSASTRAVVDKFFELSSASTAEGAAALYAYESQQPGVAKTKREGLVKFYGMKDDSAGVEFFKVHEKADEWHSQAEKEIIESTGEGERAVPAVASAAKALYQFLDGVSEQIRLRDRFVCSLN
ncbi:MAG: CADD family putative folate metabolism protein [Elusimicrobia bacterium]|nr:CADD family putative folate metabolism protein [Elusimicrobiota bacterium]